ncbi:MAG: polysulfide reductase [Pseudonocardia sp.]|jgi:hypothetical protein|nr:polysulfide reductase [Pseudonocardia sp.]
MERLGRKSAVALPVDTAIPAWHDAHREMPIVFAGSALAAAGGLAMIGTPTSENTPATRGILGAAVELTAAAVLERHPRDGIVPQGARLAERADGSTPPESARLSAVRKSS